MFRVQVAAYVIGLVFVPSHTLFGQSTAVGDSAFITALNSRQGRWFTGQHLGHSTTVEIHNVRSQECLRRIVQFTPMTAALPSGADIKAQQVLGEWDGHSCHASIRWRLSDNPGGQTLQARLVRDGSVVAEQAVLRTTAYFSATAHSPGSLFLGAAWVPGGIDGVSGTDSLDVEKKERSFQPIIGFDLPLLVSLLREPAVLDRVRVVAATSLRDLASDLYVGLELYPLLTGARGGGFPLQASIGSRIGFKSKGNGFFIALHYNASGALGTALGLFK